MTMLTSKSDRALQCQTSLTPKSECCHHSFWSWIRRSGNAALLYLFGVFALLVGGLIFFVSKLQLVFLQHYIRLVNGKSIDILSGTDAALMYIFPSAFTDAMCPAIEQFVMAVKGKPDVQRFKKRLREAVVLDRVCINGQKVKTFPKLTQKVVRRFGYYIWEEDETFSLDNIVHLNEEEYTNEESLMQLLQKISERPLPENSPLWECLLLPKTSDDSESSADSQEYSILMRIHHCMCDGNTAVRICSALFDKSPRANNAEIPNTFQQTQSPLLQSNSLLRHLVQSDGRLTLPASLDVMLNTLMIALKSPWHAVMNASQEPEQHALHQTETIPDGRRLFAISESLPINLFKNIGTACNCTINDVFLFCAAGSFQRQDAAAGVPTSKHLRVSMAVQLLPPGEISQNGMTSAILSLPLTDDRSLDWLNVISKASKEQKTSSALVSYFLINLAMGNHFPRAFVKSLTQSSDICSLATTNLRGPTSTNAILGGTVKDFFLLPNIFASAAVSFSLMSYNGSIKVGVAVDRAVAPNEKTGQQLVKDFEEELKGLNEMANASLQKTKL